MTENSAKKSLCGVDCEGCFMKNDCKGCEKTGGSPFGGACMAAECLKNGGCLEKMKRELLAEIHALAIPDMDHITDLYLLKGSFINLEYPLPNGDAMKIWKDNDIYFGTQMPKKGTARCYGVSADRRYIVVGEYGENGADPELVVFVKRKNGQA